MTQKNKKLVFLVSFILLGFSIVYGIILAINNSGKKMITKQIQVIQQ
ncbi:MAG: hypothetical protein U9532_02295 ['Conium maculatum' witches'-broom phytoplasma]|nr:hypothetical protein ['Conium maculatum' witches'-broom phytoplasma]